MRVDRPLYTRKVGTDETPDEMEAGFEEDAAAAEARRTTPGERNKQIRVTTRHIIDEVRELGRRATEEGPSDTEGDSGAQ